MFGTQPKTVASNWFILSQNTWGLLFPGNTASADLLGLHILCPQYIPRDNILEKSFWNFISKATWTKYHDENMSWSVLGKQNVYTEELYFGAGYVVFWYRAFSFKWYWNTTLKIVTTRLRKRKILYSEINQKGRTDIYCIPAVLFN